MSITSNSKQEFSSFWNEDVLPHIRQCGYSFDDAGTVYAGTVYVVASTGDERYSIDFIQSVIGTLKSGFSVDEAVDLLAATIDETMERPEKEIHSGYCLDTSLGNKIRLSVWLMINTDDRSNQLSTN